MEGLGKIFNVIFKRKLLFVIPLAVFIVFVFLGAILPKEQEKFFYSDSTVNIFIVSLSYGGKISKLLLNRIFADIFCLVLFYITSYSIFLMPLNLLIIAYKGYVLGAIMIAIISNFGFTGVMLFFFGVLIQNIISLFALIVMTSASFYNKILSPKCNSSLKSDMLKVFLLSGVLIILSVIVQLISIMLFLRPFNYSFDIV